MESNNDTSNVAGDAGFGEFFNTAETGEAPVGEQRAPRRALSPLNSGSRPGGEVGGAGTVGATDAGSYQQYRDRVNDEANRFGQQAPGSGATGGGYPGGGSPNFGLQRKVGRRRVIGGSASLKTGAGGPVKSYSVAAGMQFNDVEEMRSDAISRAFAQELLERLWEKWGLDTGAPELMRKAEDVVFALLAMRTASPDADYDITVALGSGEVNLNDLSGLLASEEVTRRRFARALADDIRAYVSEPDNVRLREMLVTELGVKAEYATLAFDGSTHCSGLSTNQVMFTKQLEHMNLFDSPDVRDRMASNRDLATANFQVNNRRGAYS